MATGNVAAGWRRRQLATKMPTPRERRQTAEMQASDVYGMLDGDGSWSELHRRVIYTRARDREGRKPEPATHAWREPSELRSQVHARVSPWRRKRVAVAAALALVLGAPTVPACRQAAPYYGQGTRGHHSSWGCC
jgi:hypothetical protein